MTKTRNKAKYKRRARKQSLTDFRLTARLRINDIKSSAKAMTPEDAEKFYSLVYWMMADELGLIPHGSERTSNEANVEEQESEDQETEDIEDTPPKISKQRWAEQVTIGFGKHKDKQLSEVPRQYLRWIIGQKARSSHFRELQDAAKVLLSSCDY